MAIALFFSEVDSKPRGQAVVLQRKFDSLSEDDISYIRKIIHDANNRQSNTISDLSVLLLFFFEKTDTPKNVSTFKEKMF